MTRGNQREIDRQRAAKRNAGGKTQKDKDGLTPEQRRERDALALKAKMEAKAAAKAAEDSGGTKPTNGKK